MRVVFALTLLGGTGLLTLAVWPGMIEDVVFGFPLFCTRCHCSGSGSCWWSAWPSATSPPGRNRRPGTGGGACGRRRTMFVTLGLLWFHVPQRVAFAFCFSDLRGLVDDAPADEFRGEELGRQVGPYRVDRYAADKRGGVFFRTATGPDGIGPDQMSYGFAFRPNGQGTPFGNAHYRHRHLFGDWYVFAASDDW